MADFTDAQLVRRTIEGDGEAYGELVSRYQGHVYALAYSLVGDWADAQDVAQETFIRAYLNLDQLAQPGRFAAWLRRVTFGVTMNWLKSFRPRLFQQLDGQADLEALEIPDFEPGPPEVLERRELAEAVRRAIASLPEKYRMPLTMFHLDGLSYQKVADFLDIPLGTAKSLIHRAREKLKTALVGHALSEVDPMVQEVFNEHRLPDAFRSEVVDEITDKWWSSLAKQQQANAALREAEAERLNAMKAALDAVPMWARRLSKALPDWGFEICSHRWLDGLDQVLEIFGNEKFQGPLLGRCGDVPGRVLAQVEDYATAVDSWLDGKQRSQTDLDRQIAHWLGEPTSPKKAAAKCFVEVVRAFLDRQREEADAVAARWRSRADSTPVLQRLFYGDGLDGGLRSMCGFRTIYRLGIYLRVIGGDDSQLEETRWFCNTQMRFVFRDHPTRMSTTLGYVWGLYGYLLGHDEHWLRRKVPACAGAAVYALRAASRAGPPTPLRRWVAASLLSDVKFWYQRALNFADPDSAPQSARNVPELLPALHMHVKRV